MLKRLSSALEVAGMVLVSVGVGLVHVPAGVITAGVCVFAVGLFGGDA